MLIIRTGFLGSDNDVTVVGINRELQHCTRNYFVGLLPGTMTGATTWLLTHCSKKEDVPKIIGLYSKISCVTVDDKYSSVH